MYCASSIDKVIQEVLRENWQGTQKGAIALWQRSTIILSILAPYLLPLGNQPGIHMGQTPGITTLQSMLRPSRTYGVIYRERPREPSQCQRCVYPRSASR